MDLPEGWTRYGTGGRETSVSQWYKALGNAITLPCAGYIMVGIAEALRQNRLGFQTKCPEVAGLGRK